MANRNEKLIALAEAYFAASNAHDLDRITAMFAPDAVYRSTGVGAHDGPAAIRAMNEKFFEANPDVAWEVTARRIVPEDGVELDFVISLGGKRHAGTERVYFDAAA
ncbi:MAG: nuclear transport factor 2 family protein [Proteobacteria bacterium]|nr:nuclear transport factor 2 family protein [Pseudomonadota bacterium]